MDGSPSDNAPAKYFIGGTILQRPSLTQIGSVVYGAFGGHCDLFNYTGLVVGVDVNQKKIVTNFATESGPLVPQSNIWNQNGGGGQGGIWMSGMALSSDGDRLFWVSGNGVGHENAGTPASGSSGCRTLGEACVSRFQFHRSCFWQFLRRKLSRRCSRPKTHGHSNVGASSLS